MNWNSPLIFDIDVNDKHFVEVGSLSYDQELDRNCYAYHMLFDECPKSKVPQLGLDETNFVDFLGVDNFLSEFS